MTNAIQYGVIMCLNHNMECSSGVHQGHLDSAQYIVISKYWIGHLP